MEFDMTKPDIALPDTAHEDGMDGIRARRNHLVAHWAAARMGLDDQAKARYGFELHQADHEEPGDADVLRKLRFDLVANGVAVDNAELSRIISECHKRALRDTHSTD